MRISELPVLQTPTGENEQIIINSNYVTYAVEAQSFVEKYVPSADSVIRDAISRLNSFEYSVATSAETTPAGIIWTNDGVTVTGTLAPSALTMYRIYLVHTQTDGRDSYDEYITVEEGENSYFWDKLGNTDVNLTGYLQASEADNLYARKDGPVFTSSISMGRASSSTVGVNSTAFGTNATASGNNAHAEGSNTTASGLNAHAEGVGTIANHRSQHVFGDFNVADTSESASNARGGFVEIVGNGTSEERSNARTLDWSGNESLAGSLSCKNFIKIGSTTITEAQFEKIADMATIANANGGSF